MHCKIRIIIVISLICVAKLMQALESWGGLLRYISDGDVRMRRNCWTQKKSFRLDPGPKIVQWPRT